MQALGVLRYANTLLRSYTLNLYPAWNVTEWAAVVTTVASPRIRCHATFPHTANLSLSTSA
jgi:hypothetical protein